MVGLEYTNARIRGMKSFLIKENELKVALELKSTADFAIWLENTPYKSGMEGKSISDIEAALFRDWVKTHEQILRIVPSKLGDFFRARISGYEAGALKFLINSKSGGSGNVEAYAVFFSRRLKPLVKRLLEAESIEAMVDVLEGTDYGKHLKKWLDEGKELTTELDRHHFRNLWSVTVKLPNKYRSATKMLVGKEIDLLNIMNILRVKAQHSDVEDPLIPVFYRLRKALARECLNAADVKGAVSLLGTSTYGRIVEEAAQKYDQTKSLFHFEQAVRKHLMQMYRRALYDVFTPGVALGYMKLKEAEITNLKSIAFGLENGIPKSGIEEMMIS